MTTYPVSLDLRGRPCVVVGAAPPAEEKVRGLLAAGALITVVAARPGEELRALAAAGRIALIERGYHSGDLAGARLAIAIPEGDEFLLAEVAREAEAAGVLLNVVDRPALCGFLAPAVVRRGDLTVAVSTGGKAPALAARLRQRLEEQLGEEHARFLDLAGHFRAPVAARWPDFERRRELWYRLVDSDALDHLRRGDDRAARARFEEILGVEAEGP